MPHQLIETLDPTSTDENSVSFAVVMRQRSMQRVETAPYGVLASIGAIL